MYVRCILMVDCQFGSSLPFPILCLVILSVVDSGVLKLPTVVVNLSVSPLSSISFYLNLKFSFGWYVQIQGYVFLRGSSFYHCAVPLFVSSNFVAWKSTLSDIKIAILALKNNVCMVYFSPPFHLQATDVLHWILK